MEVSRRPKHALLTIGFKTYTFRARFSSDQWSMLRPVYINIISGQTLYYRRDAAKISDKFRNDCKGYEID